MKPRRAKNSAGISYHKATHGQKHTQCFFQFADILNAQYEHLPPHQTPTARHLSGDLFSRAARALPANQRTWKPVLDVQHRQPGFGDGAFSGKAYRDQARSDLDDSGSACLDCLRGAGVGCVLVVDARTCWWACGCAGGVESGWDGSNGVALGVWVVFSDSVVVAVFNCAGAERESCARSATGMGSSVSRLLVVLVGSDRRDDFDPLVIGPPPLEHLALRKTPSLAERTVGAALRGRPWFWQEVKKHAPSVFCVMIKATGGHGGPPLQFVLHGQTMGFDERGDEGAEFGWWRWFDKVRLRTGAERLRAIHLIRCR